MTREKILVIDDSPDVREILTRILGKEGYQVRAVKDGTQALKALEDTPYDVALTDLRMAGIGGMELLETIKRRFPEVFVIIVTGYATIESAVEAMKKGAYDYIAKPFSEEEIRHAIARVIETKKLREENQALRQELRREYNFDNIIGRSDRLREVFRRMQKAAASDSPVIIYGESGTGKELISRAIHYNSRRADGPFVPLNCGAIPESLLESELFGYVRGAFTGAVRDKLGLFALADKGTVFLDEIGDLPLPVQVKLLRVLQEPTITPVGGLEPVTIDFRLCTATNRDLQAMVTQGTFREDLFYRLHVIPIYLPPLRERKEDISLLVDHFVQKYGMGMMDDEETARLPSHVMDRIMQYDWPGNIRELENFIQRYLIVGDHDPFLPAEAPGDRTASSDGSPAQVGAREDLLSEQTRRAERGHILRILKECQGHRSNAARRLGISRRTLYEKMKEHNIQSEII